MELRFLRKHKSSFGRLVLHVAQTQYKPLTVCLQLSDSVQFKEWMFLFRIIDFFAKFTFLKKDKISFRTKSMLHVSMQSAHNILQCSFLYFTAQRHKRCSYQVLPSCHEVSHIHICELPTPSHLLLARFRKNSVSRNFLTLSLTFRSLLFRPDSI